MALNIKDPATIALADDVAALAKESKTQAVRTALSERKLRLTRTGGTLAARREAMRELLEHEVWPQVGEGNIGRGVSRDEREAILG